MSLALNEAQFSMFIQYLKQESSETLRIRKAATIIGQQRDQDLWVMGQGLQIDVHGQIIPPERQSYIWLDWSVQQGLGNISMQEVLPTVEDVLEDQELSSAIGWAIQLKSLLVCKEEVRLVKVLLRDSFQGRSAHNWSLLLLCAKQVNFIHVVYFLYHNFHFHIHVVDYGSWI